MGGTLRPRPVQTEFTGGTVHRGGSASAGGPRAATAVAAAYFYALESEVRRLAPDTDYYIPGCGCAAYCFAVDGNFAAGVPAAKAAAEFVRTHKGRPFPKGEAAACS